MGRHNSVIPTALPDPRVSRLENEIDDLRRLVIRLMPEKYQALLLSYHTCKSRNETHSWQTHIAEELLDGAEVTQHGGGELFVDRACCPLCGNGASSSYAPGFSFPEGLRRHLAGWGRSQKCDVMEVAFRLAMDYWNREFSESEKKEALLRADEHRKRLLTEDLILTAPDGEAALMDDVGIFQKARDADQLAWAEQRLCDLGFHLEIEGRVRSYKWDRDDCTIFADPRKQGELTFFLYRKPLPKRSLKPSIRLSFSIPDRWKNNLREKLESSVTQLLPRK